MKRLFFMAVSLLLLANTCSMANRRMKADFSNVSFQKEDKVKIKKEELPADARKTLEGDAFKGWMIFNSFKTKSGEYEVELKKGENVQTIKFDKDGKLK